MSPRNGHRRVLFRSWECCADKDDKTRGCWTHKDLAKGRCYPKIFCWEVQDGCGWQHLPSLQSFPCSNPNLLLCWGVEGFLGIGGGGVVSRGDFLILRGFWGGVWSHLHLFVC